MRGGLLLIAAAVALFEAWRRGLLTTAWVDSSGKKHPAFIDSLFSAAKGTVERRPFAHPFGTAPSEPDSAYIGAW